MSITSIMQKMNWQSKCFLKNFHVIYLLVVHWLYIGWAKLVVHTFHSSEVLILDIELSSDSILVTASNSPSKESHGNYLIIKLCNKQYAMIIFILGHDRIKWKTPKNCPLVFNMPKHLWITFLIANASC